MFVVSRTTLPLACVSSFIKHGEPVAVSGMESKSVGRHDPAAAVLNLAGKDGQVIFINKHVTGDKVLRGNWAGEDVRQVLGLWHMVAYIGCLWETCLIG